MNNSARVMMACSLALSLAACAKDRAATKDNDSTQPARNPAAASTQEPKLVTRDFGATPDGQKATLYTLTNANGMVAKITDFGATLVELHVPDKSGKTADVVLGFDNAAGYAAKENPYFGCTVGRVANRIAKGKFTLDGKEYTLATNNAPNHLHGGDKGFSHRLWRAEPVKSKEGQALRFTYISKDGEEGYPGELKAIAIYTLTDDNALKIEMKATAKATTVVNLCNHTYWNLGGDKSGHVLDHRLRLNASNYTPTDSTLIPTGEVAPVKGTPFDFTKPKAVGHPDIKSFKTPEQAAITGGGYDINFAVDGSPNRLRKVAELTDPKSGRKMVLRANQPGVQLYTGNWLDGKKVKGKGGTAYPQHAGLCLETQKFPDAPNQPDFPSIVLQPGDTYRHVMVHEFSAE